MRPITIILGLLMMLALPSCKECSEDDKSPETFLGPDYWPLYGTWRLEEVRIDAYENSDGPSSGYMHEITWDADGTFVVEWANEVIQVGHVEEIVKVSVLQENAFLITVNLESDCPTKDPWFCGEYSITAATDSISGDGAMQTTGFSFPWGNPSRRKSLRYDKIL